MKDCQPAETVGLVCGRIGNMQSNGAVEILKVFDGGVADDVYRVAWRSVEALILAAWMVFMGVRLLRAPY
jgi:hypothetical protein